MTSVANDSIVIRRPDDWHAHLRDGVMLEAVLPHTTAQFARAIVMPNLAPPVSSIEDTLAYRERILRALPAGMAFEPLMTCYITDKTRPEDIEKGYAEKVWVGAKLFPAGATTNSQNGVNNLNALDPVFERMEKIGMPLLVHGESTDPGVDVFDRETAFMETSMIPLLKKHQGLKVVIEHVSTAETADIVRAYAPRAAGSITAHHLALNRNALFNGGLKPHLYCLPIIKAERHQLALRKAATSGESCFFLGTDSAPHLRANKEAVCGSAGMFTAPTALQTYVQVFDEENALDRFEAFASLNGAGFYGLPVNDATVTLQRVSCVVPATVAAGNGEIVVFRGGEELPWSL